MKRILSFFLLICMALAGSVSAYAVSPADTQYHQSLEDYTLSQSKLVHDALLLVGNVRYVWGGGHIGTYKINGVNPIWHQFNKLYADAPENSGVGVDNYFCPLHPNGAEGETCNFKTFAAGVKAVAQQRSNQLNIPPSTLYKALEAVDFPIEGIPIHRFDGLDCTGFCKWLVYQQVPTLAEEIDGTIANSSFVEEVDSFLALEPGDFVSWRGHIVMILGKAGPGCYIHVESTPGVLRLGVTRTSPDVYPIGQDIILAYYDRYNMNIKDSLNIYTLTQLDSEVYFDDFSGEFLDSGLKAVRLRNLNRDLEAESIYDTLRLPKSKSEIDT